MGTQRRSLTLKRDSSHREADADRQAASAGPGVQLNRSKVAVGNALDDSEPQATAGNVELVATKKSVEDPPAIRDGNTRPRVHDGQQRMMIRVRYGDIDPPTRRRI